MPKIKQGKKLIISLLCLMLAALISFSVFFVVLKHRESNLRPQGADGYDFANGRFDNKNKEGYSNTDFYISNYYELLEFSISVAYGYSFAGKTVYLENNIDAKSANWQPIGASMNGTTYYHIGGGFGGTFDGQNHTISNIKCEIYNYKLGLNGYVSLGLFSQLDPGAKILNVRIYNSSYEAQNVDWGIFGEGGGYIGGLTGELSYQGEYEISNVVVDKLNINCGSLFRAAGLICKYDLMAGGGDGNIEINDCYLGDVVLNGVDSTRFHYIGVTNTSFAEMGFMMNFKFNNIVVKNKNNYSLYFVDTDTEIDNSKYINTDTELFSEKEKALTGVSSDASWYCPTDSVYNEGWPYLMSFVGEFDTYTFKSAGHGSVKTSTGSTTIKVPQKNIDGTAINPLSNFVGTNKQTLFYGVLLTATPHTGYEFTYWNKKLKEYTAHFSEELYNYKFATINGIEPEVFISFQPGVNQGNIQLNAYYGDLYTFEQSFKDGNTILTYNYNNGSWKIIYTLPGKYTINNNGLSVLVDGSNKVKALDKSQVYTIAPTVKLKSYEVNYK